MAITMVAGMGMDTVMVTAMAMAMGIVRKEQGNSPGKHKAGTKVPAFFY
jgi:hypothetical protein